MANILFAASEAVPFAKSGGLADIAGTLPGALCQAGADVRLIMPKYGCIGREYVEKMRFIGNIYVPVGWRSQYCGIFELHHQGVTVYFIDNEFYFSGGQLYGYIHEDVEKFAFFSKAALSVLPTLGFRPDIIHCNDWQTAAIPMLLRVQFQDNPFYRGIRTVMTIHNLHYQGIWGRQTVTDVFGLPESLFTADKLEFHGNANLLKSGLVYADAITTVSPGYAAEIQTPEGGEGLDGLLRARSAQLTGILNGVSPDLYDPARDPCIYQPYRRRDFVAGKRINKRHLQQELGLSADDDAMLIGIVSRMTDQKGFDLIAQLMEELMGWHIQMAVLGRGEFRYESMFGWYADRFPDKVHAAIRFDDVLAHKIYAGCDAFLMPSLFEPCGLSQLISLRYGTVPIVRETGGLAGTVTAYNEYTGEGTGFSFAPYRAHDLLTVLRYARSVFDDKPAWRRIVRAGMRCDFTWRQSAAQYLSVYEALLS